MAQYIKKVFKPTEHAEWLKSREEGIGSSEIGTLLGVNKFQTPYQLWERKMGLSTPVEENEAMVRGHLLEDGVAQWFEYKTGKRVIKASAKEWMAISTENPLFRVSPDRLYYLHGNSGAKGVLECKTTNFNVDQDNIPQTWFCQLQYQMGVLGLSEGSLVWLKGTGFDFGYQTFEFNAEIFETIKSSIVEFWTRYVDGDERPTPTSIEDITRLYPAEEVGKSVVADGKVSQAIQRLIELKDEEKRLKEKKEELELIVKGAFGDAEKLIDVYGDTLATWKASKGSNKFNVERFKESHPQLYSAFCEQTQGTRRFLVK